MASRVPLVYVVDDDEAVREALTALIRSAGYDAVTCAGAGAFLAAYDPERTACLLLDIRMPEINGLDLQESLAGRGIRIPTIIISGHGNVRNAVRAMRAGAVDFIEKPFRRRALLDLIQKGLAQDAQRRDRDAERSDFSVRLESLSERERETLDILMKGYTAKEAALVLGISHRTVEAHRNRIMSKLHIASLVELAGVISNFHRPAGET